MFDLTLKSITVGTALFSLLFYLLVSVWNRSLALCAHNLEEESIKHKLAYRGLVLGMFVLLMTNVYETDYFSYAEIVHEFNFRTGAENHIEEIYTPVVALVSRHYLMFRAIVWGASLYAAMWVLRLYKVNKYSGLYVLLSMSFVMHFISRASLAVGLYFIGFALFTKALERKKWRKLLLGVVVMLLSVLFHKSAIFLVAMTVSIVVPFNKKTIVLVLLAFPGLVYVAREFFMEFMFLAQASSGGMSEIGSSMEGYAGRATMELNGLGMVREVYMSLCFYAPLVCMMKRLYFDKRVRREEVSKMVIHLFKISVGIGVVSLIFLFMGFEGLDFYRRTLWMVAISVPVLMCLCYREGVLSKKVLMRLVNFGWMYQVFVYAYSFYGILK